MAVTTKCEELPPMVILGPGISVAFCSPAKSFDFGGLLENPLVGKKLYKVLISMVILGPGIWLWLKKTVPTWNPGKWKHYGPQSAVCPCCLILSQTHMAMGQNPVPGAPTPKWYNLFLPTAILINRPSGGFFPSGLCPL